MGAALTRRQRVVPREGRLVILNPKMCCYKFENIPISSRVIGEKLGFSGHFEFLRPKRKSIFRTYIFYLSLLSNLKICH